MYAFKRKYKFILGLVIIIIISRYDLILFSEPMDDRVGELFLMHFFGGSYKMEKLDMFLSLAYWEISILHFCFVIIYQKI